MSKITSTTAFPPSIPLAPPLRLTPSHPLLPAFSHPLLLPLLFLLSPSTPLSRSLLFALSPPLFLPLLCHYDVIDDAH